MMIASSTATTTYKPTRQPSSPTSQKVRSRFLYKIGIVDNSTPSSSTAISKNNSFNHLTSVVETLPTRDLQNVPRFSEPLKYNRCDERMREERHCAQIISYEENKMDVSGDEEGVPPSTLSSKKKKQISFGEVVNVVPIPMRNEYSDRIRSRLWNNCAEIYENAARNTVEFASENYNWRTALEDEHFNLCAMTGELIHPVHYQMRYAFGGGFGGSSPIMKRSPSSRQKKKQHQLNWNPKF